VEAVFYCLKPVLLNMSLLQILTIIGTITFAITGALKARTHRMDVFGGAVLAFVTAYGGGTIRDLLLGKQPVNWVNDFLALYFVVGSAVFVFLFKMNHVFFKRLIYITDAVGLGVFTIAGIQVAFSLGATPIYAVIMGVITATFGGLLADILCSVQPSILRRGELYATSCLIGGICFVALKKYQLANTAETVICVLLIIVIRIVATRRQIKLPAI
jgi:uncharacterized membrane protein YeiH